MKKNNKKTGFILIYRSIFNHWIGENESYFYAFLKILKEVNYKSTEILIHGELIKCDRGQSLNSVATWVNIFNKGSKNIWTSAKVRNFFKLLEKDGMIEIVGLSKTTLLTVLNYDKYQQIGGSEEDKEVVKLEEQKPIEIESTYTEQQFLDRWKKARMYYDKLPTNISELSFFERPNFDKLKAKYSANDFDEAICGLFFQDTYKSVRLRPTHFLEIENFEKYLTCWRTKEKLFETKTYSNKL